MTAFQGSSLGDTAAEADSDDRIVLQDGLGLVQVGDVGKAFDVVAFSGDIQAHKLYAAACRKNKENVKIIHELPLPSGRALVPEDFTHAAMDIMKEYGTTARLSSVSKTMMKLVLRSELYENEAITELHELAVNLVYTYMVPACLELATAKDAGSARSSGFFDKIEAVSVEFDALESHDIQAAVTFTQYFRYRGNPDRKKQILQLGETRAYV
ncbi:uncharacterized protein FMAN_09695 [Fusarium mangiferae]|uniref:Uncharacterized protein n=1 Tax=Fusarium mangiferae TaxID=192010 RepID=A0A1L7UB73_FUSMA|nr:uncharacterized protein FMAN_09695 [Fusarium mangiferae]CVL07960.1 uncharacterized protein FMAN_09695 [Fusarium mangiferae]